MRSRLNALIAVSLVGACALSACRMPIVGYFTPQGAISALVLGVADGDAAQVRSATADDATARRVSTYLTKALPEPQGTYVDENRDIVAIGTNRYTVTVHLDDTGNATLRATVRQSGVPGWVVTDIERIR